MNLIMGEMSTSIFEQKPRGNEPFWSTTLERNSPVEVQDQTAVTAYFPNKQLLLFAFTGQYSFTASWSIYIHRVYI